MVCSADRSKAVVPVLVLLFVALWFILRGNLLYVFPCVILFLCFSVLLVLRLPRLGKRELILVLFVSLFGLCLFRFVGFLLLLGSGKGCGLWLWHSLGFSLTLFSSPVSKIEINRLLQPLYFFKSSRAHLRRCVFCFSVNKWGTHLAQTFLSSKRFFRIVCTLPSDMPVQLAISLIGNRASCSTTIFTAAMLASVTEV